MRPALAIEGEPFDYAASCLAANMDALAVGGRTRDSVLQAAARGKVIRLADGHPALEIDGQLLGAPGDDASRERTLSVVEQVGDGIVVVLGLGLGHTLRELRARTRAKLLVYEPDPAVLRTVLSWGPIDLGGIPVVSDLVDLRLHWASMVGSRPSAVLVCTPGYQRFYPEAEAALGVAVSALVRNVQINENTHYLRSKIWLTDIVENLPQIVGTTPFLALEGKYQGVPAFIVGAGPSLNKNGPALREATKKGIVIAVNTSGKALVRHGVRPHVLACIESIDLSHDLAGLPFIDEVVRAFSLSGSPAHFATGKGPLLPIVENLPTFEPLVSLLGQRGLAVGASVTTAALSLAHRLGCSPIVLVGQDLAFTGNQVYAQGTSYEGSQVRIAKNGRRVEHAWSEEAQRSHGTRVGALPTSEPLLETVAWGGESTVATSAGFTAVRNWLEAAADLMRRSSPHLRLVNATEGGARIENFEELTLAEVLHELSDRHLTSAHLLDAADATGGSITAPRLMAWAQEQLRLVKRAGRAAQLVERLATRGIGHVEKGDPPAIARAFKRLGRAETAMKKRCSAQLFVEAWGTREIQLASAQAAEVPTENSSHAEALHALRTEAHLSAVIVHAARELADKLLPLTRLSAANGPASV